ncbi:hypothetical protein, partial [uncultured Lamprocystis sp.]|uniref:hypothetical protein n=1 Tax=uncultured Lamprocystis sp. TaxID=543132 RepID=UPI0025E32CE2
LEQIEVEQMDADGRLEFSVAVGWGEERTPTSRPPIVGVRSSPQPTALEYIVVLGVEQVVHRNGSGDVNRVSSIAPSLTCRAPTRRMRFAPDTGDELRPRERVRHTGLAQTRNGSHQGAKVFKAIAKPEALAE